MDLFEVLPVCFPNSLYIWTGSPTNQKELDDSLIWLSNDPKPTWQQIENAWNSEIQNRANVEKTKKEVLESAKAKLFKIGLTDDEAKAIIGI